MPAVDPKGVPTQTFEWGASKWLVTPDATEGARTAFGEVVLLPGRGHDRHNHPDAEEILHLLSGEGEAMLADRETFRARAGDTVYVPIGVYHALRNTGWEPLRLLAIYNPGGPERLLRELPGFRELPPGETPAWRRA